MPLNTILFNLRLYIMIEYSRNKSSRRENKMDNNNFEQNTQPVQPQYQQPVQPQPAPYQPVQPQPASYQPVQPVYQQPVYQQPGQPYGMPAPAYMGGESLLEEEERKKNLKKANILCFISLGLMVIPSLISGIFSGISDAFKSLSDNYDSASMLVTVLSSTLGGSYIASWVLMLIARIKYKTTFSKVLMWIYIGILAAGILATILIIAMCAYIVKDCQGF